MKVVFIFDLLSKNGFEFKAVFKEFSSQFFIFHLEFLPFS
jgi:hypothetical protein